jgi:signal transduction histidine kinase
MERIRAIFTRNVTDPGACVPPEVPWLRASGLFVLVAFVAAAFATEPRPALEGRGLGVLAAVLAFGAAALGSMPLRGLTPERRLPLLLTVIAASLVGIALQPDGLWLVTPYVVGSIVAVRMPARPAAYLFFGDLAATVVVAVLVDHGDQAIGIVVGTIPWFLFMRLLRRTREEHEVTKGLVRELEASRSAEAKAAAEAERSRLAREMHDVLAHSLSALALQLESTRLVAADRGTDPEVSRAIERAHGLAASGLEEARRAIGALRGEELPGPQRLPALVEASGLPVRLDVSGAPRELAPDARLALYRTAQEALTNVRRHAVPEAVELRLDYRDDATVLVVADHGGDGAPPPVSGDGGGYGLAGMRERAELLGGRLSAHPTPDGFRVELWLPA